MRKMKDKKAAMEMEEIVKWIIIIGALAIIVVGIFLLRDKMGSLLESVRTFLKFGK